MTVAQHVVIAVRCRDCYEMVLGNVIDSRSVLIQTHKEPDTDARCTGSKSIVPLPVEARS